METTTADQKLAQVIAQVETLARQGENDSAAVALGFAEKVMTQGMDYALRWSEDQLVSWYTYEYWAQVRSTARNGGLDDVEALRRVVEALESELISNYIVERGSSPMSNAVSQCRASAAAKFVRTGRGWLELVMRRRAEIV